MKKTLSVCTILLTAIALMTTLMSCKARSSAEARVANALVAPPATPTPTPQQPIRPVSGAITLGFNVNVSWASKPHNGIDYVSSLGSLIKNVGTGVVHQYTKPNARRFGSINPDGNGPATWVRYKLATGEPIYVLYGHQASSYTDKSTGVGTKNFKFSCQYSIDWKSGNTVQSGSLFLKTAPFYNGGKAAQHLHISVFKPNKKSNNTYYDPPASGWGYSDINVTEGTYINPEDFFTKSQYKLSINP